MSEFNNNDYRDYSIYDSMSTEELERILQSDSYTLDINNSDEEVILYIMEVIAKREKENPNEYLTDVNTAWTSFCENYLPYLGDNTSLYDYDNNGFRTPVKRNITMQIRTFFIRAACVIGTITVIFFAGTATAIAFGYNIWGAIAQWTNDTFFFVTPKNADPQQGTITEDDNDLVNALREYGVNYEVAPNWLPGDYVLTDLDITESPKGNTFVAIYEEENRVILVTISSFSKPINRIYEKDDKDVVIYKVNDIEHYIMSNLSKTDIIWKRENLECFITGDFSLDDAKEMINSIYERN